jgi:D-alanyl-D-alanine carboxypeptidase
MPGRRISFALSAGLAIALLAGVSACAPERVPVASAAPTASATPTPPVDKPKAFFDRNAHSLDDPASIWVVVNKLRPLSPKDYVPATVTTNVPHVSAPLMREEAARAMEAMFAASAAEGGGALQIQNSYRSFAVQTNTHNRLVAQLGVEKARAQSAQPGYSEHQTGLVADIASLPSKCDIAQCFGQTQQGIWLAANSWRFGYIVRYPADKTMVTGYIYEPWHFRYVGVELATEMHEKGISTLEEFFGLPAAPDYIN